MRYSISNKLNKPTLMADSRILTPILYGLSDIPASKTCTAYAQNNIAAFHEVGIDLVSIDTSLYQGWHKAEPYEAEAVLAEIAYAVEANPNVKVLIRLHVNAPYWWLRDHPEECVIYRTPEGDIPGIDNGNHDRLITHDYDNHMRASLASEKWLQEACENLALLCQALKENEEGEAVLGIQIACGLYGEWHKWGRYEDVSKPAKDFFKGFLREKYKTNEALACAWNKPGITFDTAAYCPEKFRPADEGMFYDPRLSQDAIDSRECAQSIPPSAILRFCRVLKQQLPQVLSGAFYGYYLQTGGDHLKVERLYNSDDIDVLCGPFPYLSNRNPEGIPMQRGLLESTRLRKKLWLTEMDQRPCGPSPIHGGDPEMLPATLAVLKRNFLQVVLAGQGQWYYDHRAVNTLGVLTAKQRRDANSVYRKFGWWDTPELMEQIGKLQLLADRISARPYTAEADVLLVYDKASYFYRQHGEPQNNDYLLHDAVARCGVAYDCIYSDELEVAELSRYQCVIFANAYVITPENRQLYRRLLKNTTTLWLGAEGYCDGATLSCDNLSQTVGMALKKTAAVSTIRFRGEEISGEGYNAPSFAVCPNEKTVALAYYENGEIAAAVQGKDIWFGFPWPTRGFMEEVLSVSGAHKYGDRGDSFLAGAGIVAINCTSGGERCLTLKNGKQINLSLAPYTVAAFDAVTGEQLL